MLGFETQSFKTKTKTNSGNNESFIKGLSQNSTINSETKTASILQAVEQLELIFSRPRFKSENSKPEY